MILVYFFVVVLCLAAYLFNVFVFTYIGLYIVKRYSRTHLSYFFYFLAVFLPCIYAYLFHKYVFVLFFANRGMGTLILIVGASVVLGFAIFCQLIALHKNAIAHKKEMQALKNQLSQVLRNQ